MLTVLLLELAFLTGAQAQGTTYTTSFPLTENPISEAAHWIDGAVHVRTTAGLAFGTQSGTDYLSGDSLAALSGQWGPNQTVTATVHTVNQQGGGSNIYEEVEIRLRSTISAQLNTGYEITFRCNQDGSQYAQIVRIDQSSFAYVAQATGPGLSNGDVIKATIVGNVITGYINGSQVVQGTDNTYTGGSPGIGFYLQGGSGALDSDFGFTSLTASDAPVPGVPTNLRILPIAGVAAPARGFIPRGRSAALWNPALPFVLRHDVGPERTSPPRTS